MSQKAEKTSFSAAHQYFQKQMLTTRFGLLVKHDIARLRPRPLIEELHDKLPMWWGWLI